MKKILSLTFVYIWCFLFSAFGQEDHAGEIFAPVKWSYDMEDLGNNEYELIFKATIDEGWHLYSQFIEEGGPVPTSFGFDSIPEIELLGPVEERGDLETDFDPNFEMELKWYSHQVQFVQKVKLNTDHVMFGGFHEFMTCDDQRCLPPEFIEIDIELGSEGSVFKVREISPPVETGSTDSKNK